MNRVSFMDIHERKGRGRCRYCGKTIFDLANAERVAKHKRRVEGTNHVPYRCPQQFGWHIGSSNGGVTFRRPTEQVRRTISIRNYRKDAA